MSLQCAISGEPLTSENVDGIVVTPSGHICLKRLILAKLSENGGVDPFSDSGRPLSEDDLVSLQTSKNRPNMPPPPSTVSSFSGTLQQLAKEYDAVVLELFDTRKALQETRRELSQALYQNDAAIRVLARVAMERDAARQEAQQFQAAVQAGASTNGNDEGQAPSKKKPRLDENADLPMSNDVPSSDLDTMLEEWENLHKARRAKPKSTYTLPENWKTTTPNSWHKSTCRGLTAISQSDKLLITAGKDKQIVVYDAQGEVVNATLNPKGIVTSLDVMRNKESSDGSGLLIVAACGDENMRVYDSSSPDKESITNVGETIVGVTGHPTGKHCCAVTKNGKVLLYRISGGDIQQMKQISTFSSPTEDEYCCCAMHPDGLLVLVGTTKGEAKLWDIKNKNLTASLWNETEDAVVAGSFSSNGYHVAVAYASGAVRVWDMRKSKMMAELNVSGDNLLQSVESLAFHPDGKYLAYCGQGGLHITMVKEWKVSAALDVTDATGVLWGNEWIASIGGNRRTVTFHSGET